MVRALDEVPRLHFSPVDLAARCASHGLARFRSYSFAEQLQQFAPEARDRRAGASQHVAVAEKATA
jgi:hypothetical protein